MARLKSVWTPFQARNVKAHAGLEQAYNVFASKHGIAQSMCHRSLYVHDICTVCHAQHFFAVLSPKARPVDFHKGKLLAQKCVSLDVTAKRLHLVCVRINYA